MAKKQTFESKVNKGDSKKKNSIKLIRSQVSDKTGAIRFFEEIVSVPEGKSPENYIKELVQTK